MCEVLEGAGEGEIVGLGLRGQNPVQPRFLCGDGAEQKIIAMNKSAVTSLTSQHGGTLWGW